MKKCQFLKTACITLILICVNAYAIDSNKSKEEPVKLSSIVIYTEGKAKDVIDFYVKAFGLSIRYYDENLDFGEIETGQVSIMIASYTAGKFMVGEEFLKSPDDKANNVEIAFITDDVKVAYDRAIRAGAKNARPPTEFPWGQTAAYVYSVEGTLVGFLTPPGAKD
ncbi:MAG: VOC family protein [Cellvibrionaceae bacterium]